MSRVVLYRCNNGCVFDGHNGLLDAKRHLGENNGRAIGQLSICAQINGRLRRIREEECGAYLVRLFVLRCLSHWIHDRKLNLGRNLIKWRCNTKKDGASHGLSI